MEKQAWSCKSDHLYAVPSFDNGIVLTGHISSPDFTLCSDLKSYT